MGNFFSGSEKNFDGLDGRLREICDGLVFISESDHPVEPFRIRQGSVDAKAALMKYAGLDENTRAEVVTPAAFFDRLTRNEEWFGDAERKTAKRFAELYELLAGSLRDLSVYRFGDISIQIFVAGRDPSGEIVGVRTQSVET